MRSRFLIAMVCALAACWAPGKRPVAQAQFCITPKHGVGELVDTFRSIARDEGMDLLGEGIPENFNKAQGFSVAVRSKDDQDGFSASINGPPSNQVMMGFTEGHDKRLSAAFARRVIARLRSRWNVQVVSGEVGMFPLKTC
jgi:hypothetical protein